MDNRNFGNRSAPGLGSRGSPLGMPEARMTSGHPHHSEPNSNRLENQSDSGIDLLGPQPRAPWLSEPTLDPALFDLGPQVGTNDGHQQKTSMRNNVGGAEQRKGSSISQNNTSFSQNGVTQYAPPASNSNRGHNVRGGVTNDQPPLSTSFEPLYPGAYPYPTNEIMEENERRKMEPVRRQSSPMMNTLDKQAPMASSQQMAGAGSYTQQGRRGQPSNGASQHVGANVAFAEPHLAQQENGFPPSVHRATPTYQSSSHNGQNMGALTQFGFGIPPEAQKRLSQIPNHGLGQALTQEQLTQMTQMQRAYVQGAFYGSQIPPTSAQQPDLQQQKARLQSQNNNGSPQMFTSQGQQYGPSRATPKTSPPKTNRKRSTSKAATTDAAHAASASTATINFNGGIQSTASPAVTNSSPASNQRSSKSSVFIIGKVMKGQHGELYVAREGKLVKLIDLFEVHGELYVATPGTDKYNTPQTTSTQQTPRPVSTTPQAALRQFQNGPAKQPSYLEEYTQQNSANQEKFAMKQREVNRQQALEAYHQQQAFQVMQAKILLHPPNIGGAQAATQNLSYVTSGLPQYMPRNPLVALPTEAFGLIAESPSQPTKSFLMSPRTPQQGASTLHGSHAAAASSQNLQHAQLDGQMFSSPHVPLAPQEVQRSTKRPREESSENAEQAAKRVKATQTVENNAAESEAPAAGNTVRGNGTNTADSLAQGTATMDDIPTLPKSTEDFTTDFDDDDFSSWVNSLGNVDFDTQTLVTSPTGESALPTQESNTENAKQVEQTRSPETHGPEEKDQNNSAGQVASVVQGSLTDQGDSVNPGASKTPQMTAEVQSTSVASGGDTAGYEYQEGSEMDNTGGREGLQLEDEEDDPMHKVFEDFMRAHAEQALDDLLPGVWGGNAAEHSDVSSPNAPADRAPSPLQQIINCKLKLPLLALLYSSYKCIGANFAIIGSSLLPISMK